MKKCCVWCKGESDGSDSWGGPDPCLGHIPGVMFACCGHGWLVANDEGELIDRCYVFCPGRAYGLPYDGDSFYLTGHEARLWFRAMGLTVPDPEKLRLDNSCYTSSVGFQREESEGGIGTMATSLVSSAIPKSRSGRKAAEADPELKAALLDALNKNPRTKVEGQERPAGHGPDTDYDTEGKAESAGRRYSKAIAEELGKTVRVSVYAKNDDKKAPYRWRIYIPLSQSEEKKAA